MPSIQFDLVVAKLVGRGLLRPCFELGTTRVESEEVASPDTTGNSNEEAVAMASTGTFITYVLNYNYFNIGDCTRYFDNSGGSGGILDHLRTARGFTAWPLLFVVQGISPSWGSRS